MARRVVLGKRANGDYGLFISKASQDANSASNENLIFNTKDSGTFSLKTLQVFATANNASSSSTVESAAIASGSSSGTGTANTAVGQKLIMKSIGEDYAPLQTYTGSSVTFSRSTSFDYRGFDSISGLDYSNDNTVALTYVALTSFL